MDQQTIFFPLPIFDYIGVPVLSIVLLLLFVIETKYELRKRKKERFSRVFRNSKLSFVSLIVLRAALIPFMVWAAVISKEETIGLLYLISIPIWFKVGFTFIILDYGNYLWHVLNHKIEFLWRFHNVHHIDLDLDVSTAFRFHFGELLLSIVFRGGIILLIGVSPFLVLLYEILYEGATAFHHSNMKLPIKLERMLSKLIVTPRMHGVHHSIVQRETNSNFSVIFSFWDRLHRTIKLNVPQDQIDIGVPSYRDYNEQNIKNLLLIPFNKQRPWKLPDGTIPFREERKDNGFMEE